MSIKISIITVVYNRASTIEQTIQSVIAQDYNDIEYIVIDGDSTDGTKEIIEKYSHKISKYISEPDDGIYNAFNKGLQLATGDYVQYIGSDDCLFNCNIIGKIATIIDKENPDILSAGIMLVNEKYKIEHYSGNEFANKNDFNGDRMIPHPGLFVRTKLMKEKKFDESFRIAADYDFFLGAYYDKKIQIKYVSFPVVYFCLLGVSSNDHETCRKENIRIWKKYNLYENIEKINSNRNLIKRRFKNFLIRCNIYDFLRLIHSKLHGWKKHTCNNSYCRWCNFEKGKRL